jgi:hypothetical protein
LKRRPPRETDRSRTAAGTSRRRRGGITSWNCRTNSHRPTALELKLRAIEERSEREEKMQAVHASAMLEQVQKEAATFTEFVNRE